MLLLSKLKCSKILFKNYTKDIFNRLFFRFWKYYKFFLFSLKKMLLVLCIKKTGPSNDLIQDVS